MNTKTSPEAYLTQSADDPLPASASLFLSFFPLMSSLMSAHAAELAINRSPVSLHKGCQHQLCHCL